MAGGGIDNALLSRYIYATAMTPNQPDTDQSMQRVRVGMTGLAAVLVLIGLASAVFKSASSEAPITAVGSSKPEVVANMTDATIDNTANEPLAELGVAPSAAQPEENVVKVPKR
jgi:hypothetical protein